ncbi:hypothetical protein PXO_05701 [Xanthomonas oryzae pv. oryzae PXO99A]|uniref:Uncharacterized protein n=1 Tax=Xanthomonas oryzae pv. oryzae (strain PXO99A) TaxID=360094 RepID=A0A0K0GNR5_XANOP|nr:hypothetical protein PXO_05701 [Xanthomonas oryzae pv. oryzae PXO99A]
MRPERYFHLARRWLPRTRRCEPMHKQQRNRHTPMTQPDVHC